MQVGRSLNENQIYKCVSQANFHNEYIRSDKSYLSL